MIPPSWRSPRLEKRRAYSGWRWTMYCLKEGGGLVLAAPGLHRNDLRPVLQHEVDLAVFVGEVPGFHLKLAPKLLQNAVFRQRPLEVVVAFQQDGAVVHPGHMLEQASVKDKQLEWIQLVKGSQGVFHFGDVVHPVPHPGRHRPLDGFLKVPGPTTLPDGTVHEFPVCPGQLRDDAAEHHGDASAVDLAVVFGEVVLVDPDQLILDLLDLADFGRVPVLQPGSHALRHPTDDEVVVVSL